MLTGMSHQPHNRESSSAAAASPLTGGQQQLPPEGSSSGDALQTYDMVAQTIGGIPSLRKYDNLVQGIIVVLCTVLGSAIGYACAWWSGAFIGAVAAMLLATLLSGAVLMVLGWVRAARSL
jgi:hypothetical protein